MNTKDSQPGQIVASTLRGMSRRCLLLAFLCSLASAPAQPAAEEQKESSRPTFTAIALSPIPQKKLFYRNGEQFTAIEVPTTKRSQPYPIPPTDVLEIYALQENLENPYQLLGRAKLVPETRKMLFFLRPEKTEGTPGMPLQLFGIDDSEKAFPRASFRFISFIKEPLAMSFNEEQFRLDAGRPVVRKVKLTKEGAFTPIIVADARGKVLGGTRLFSHAANREMVLMFPPKNQGKRLDLRYFSD